MGIGDSISGGVFKNQCYFNCDNGGARLISHQDFTAFNVWALTVGDDNTPGKRRIQGFLNGDTAGWYSGGLAGISGDDYQPPIATTHTLTISGSYYSFQGDMVELILYAAEHSPATVASVVQYMQSKYHLSCPALTSANSSSVGGPIEGPPDPSQCGATSLSQVPFGSKCAQTCHDGFVREAGGQGQSTCDTGGWTGPPVTCGVTCPVLQAPRDAQACSKVIQRLDFGELSPAVGLGASDVTTGLPRIFRSWSVVPHVPAARAGDYWLLGLSSGPFGVGTTVLKSDAATESCDSSEFLPSTLTQASPRWASKLLEGGAVEFSAAFSIGNSAVPNQEDGGPWFALASRLRDAGNAYWAAVALGGPSGGKLKLQRVSGGSAPTTLAEIDVQASSGVPIVLRTRAQGGLFAAWVLPGHASVNGSVSQIELGYAQLGIENPSLLSGNEACEKLSLASQAVSAPPPTLCIFSQLNPVSSQTSVGLVSHATGLEVGWSHLETTCDGGFACQHATHGASCSWICRNGYDAINGTDGGVQCDSAGGPGAAFWAGSRPTCVVRPPEPHLGAARNISELAPGGTPILPAVEVSVDAEDVDVLFSLEGTGHIDPASGLPLFRIGACSGVISLAHGGLLDFERKTSHLLSVRATPMGTSASGPSSVLFDVLIAVLDAPEPPSFDYAADAANNASQVLRTFYRTVPESAQVGTHLSPAIPAADPDIGGSTAVLFSIDGVATLDGQPLPGQPQPSVGSALPRPLPFSIDGSTGVVSTALGLNFEGTQGYEVYLRVTDSEDPALGDTATLAVAVGDSNDPPRLPALQPSNDIREAEFLPNISFSSNLVATDEDAGAVLTFQLLNVTERFPSNGQDATRSFSLDPITGVLGTAELAVDMPALSPTAATMDGREVVGAWDAAFSVVDEHGMPSVPTVGVAFIYVLANITGQGGRTPQVVSVLEIPPQGFSTAGGDAVLFAAQDLAMGDIVAGKSHGIGLGASPLVIASHSCSVLSAARLQCITGPGVGVDHSWRFTVQRDGAGASVAMPFQASATSTFNYNSPEVLSFTGPWASMPTRGGAALTLVGNGLSELLSQISITFSSGPGGVASEVRSDSGCAQSPSQCIITGNSTAVEFRSPVGTGTQALQVSVNVGGQVVQVPPCDSSAVELCAGFAPPLITAIRPVSSQQLPTLDPHSLMPGDQAFPETAVFLEVEGENFGPLRSASPLGAAFIEAAVLGTVRPASRQEPIAKQLTEQPPTGNEALFLSTSEPHTRFFWRPPSAVGANLTLQVCLLGVGGLPGASSCSVPYTSPTSRSISFIPPAIIRVFASSDLSTEGGGRAQLEVARASGSDVLGVHSIQGAWFGAGPRMPPMGTTLPPPHLSPAFPCPFSADSSPADWLQYAAVECSLSGRAFPSESCLKPDQAARSACRQAPWLVECKVPPGVGTGHAWVLETPGCGLSSVGGFSGYAPPAIGLFSVPDPSIASPTELSTRGGQVVILEGRNFGATFRQPPELWLRRRASPSAGTSEGTARTLAAAAHDAGYDMAWYTLGGDGPGTDVVFLAENCSMVVPHVALACTASAGAGSGLVWSLVIGGQSNVPATTAYATPSVRALTLRNPSGQPVEHASTSGGTILSIDGVSFGPPVRTLATCQAEIPQNSIPQAVLNTSGCLAPPLVQFGPTGIEFDIANASVVNDSSIRVPLPAGLGTGLRVTVVRGGQSSPPSITSFSYERPTLLGISPQNASTVGSAGAAQWLTVSVRSVPPSQRTTARIYIGNPRDDGTLIGPLTATKLLALDTVTGAPKKPLRVHSVQVPIPSGIGGQRGVFMEVVQEPDVDAGTQTNTTSLSIWAMGFATLRYLAPRVDYVSVDLAWEVPSALLEAAALWGVPATRAAVQSLGVRRVTMYGANFGPNPLYGGTVPPASLVLSRAGNGSCTTQAALLSAAAAGDNAALVCPLNLSGALVSGLFIQTSQADSFSPLLPTTGGAASTRLNSSSWWTQSSVQIYTIDLTSQMFIAVLSSSFSPPADVLPESDPVPTPQPLALIQSSAVVQVSGAQPVFAVSSRGMPAGGFPAAGGAALLVATDFGTVQGGDGLEIVVGLSTWPNGTALCPVVVADGWAATAPTLPAHLQTASKSGSVWGPQSGQVPTSDAARYIRDSCTEHYMSTTGSGPQLADPCYAWCQVPPGQGSSVPMRIQRGSSVSSIAFVSYAPPEVTTVTIIDTSTTGVAWAAEAQGPGGPNRPEAQQASSSTCLARYSVSGSSATSGSAVVPAQGTRPPAACLRWDTLAAQGPESVQVPTYGGSIVLVGINFGLCPTVTLGGFPPIPTCRSAGPATAEAELAWQGTLPGVTVCYAREQPGRRCPGVAEGEDVVAVEVPPGSGAAGAGIALAAADQTGTFLTADLSGSLTYRRPVVVSAGALPSEDGGSGLLRTAGGDMLRVTGDQFGAVPIVAPVAPGISTGPSFEVSVLLGPEGVSTATSAGPPSWPPSLLQCSPDSIPGAVPDPISAGTLPALPPLPQPVDRIHQGELRCTMPPGGGRGLFVYVSVGGMEGVSPEGLLSYDPPLLWKASLLTIRDNATVTETVQNEADQVMTSVYGGPSFVPSPVSPVTVDPEVSLRSSGGDVLEIVGVNFGPAPWAGQPDGACLFLSVRQHGETPPPLLCNLQLDSRGEGEVFAAAPVPGDASALPVGWHVPTQPGQVMGPAQILLWSHNRIIVRTQPLLGDFRLHVFCRGLFSSTTVQTGGLRASSAVPMASISAVAGFKGSAGGEDTTITGQGFGPAPPSLAAVQSGAVFNFPKPLPASVGLTPPVYLLRIDFAGSCRTNAVSEAAAISVGAKVPVELGPQCAAAAGTVLAQSPSEIRVLSGPGLGINNTVRLQWLRFDTGQLWREVNVSYTFDAPEITLISPMTLYLRGGSQPAPLSQGRRLQSSSSESPGAQELSIFGHNFGALRHASLWRPGDEALAINISSSMCLHPRRQAADGTLLPQSDLVTCAVPRTTVGRKALSVTVAGQSGLLPTDDPLALTVVCAPGFYGREDEDCLPCPDGADCAGFVDGTHTYPQARPNFYNLNGSTFAEACAGLDVDSNPERQVCIVACSPAEACLGDNQCATGYASRPPLYRCASCDENYFRRAGLCVRCPDAPWVLVLVFVLLAMTAAAFAYWLNKQDINLALVSVGVDYFQVLALFASARVPWPGFLREFFVVLSAFSFNLDIATPECAVPDLGYLQQWALVMSFPVAVGATLLLAFAVVYLYKRCVLRQRGRKHLQGHAPRLIATFIMAMYVLYLYLSRTVMDIFNCVPTDPPDGRLYLEVVFEPCGEKGGLQVTLLPWAIVGLVVYVVGFPLYVGRILRKHKLEIMEDQLLRAMRTGNTPLQNPHAYEVRKRYEKLYFPFTPDFAPLWMMVLLGRKLLLALTRNMFNANPAFQLSLALLVMFIAYALQVRFRPFMSPSDRDDVLRAHRLKAFDEDPTHLALSASLKEVSVKSRRKGRAASMAGMKAASVSEKATVAAAVVGAFLINYNTVEAVLLFCAVLVTLSGIMFSTGQLDSSFYQVHRDFLAVAVVLVLTASIVYFVSVVVAEVRLLWGEAAELARDGQSRRTHKHSLAAAGKNTSALSKTQSTRRSSFSFGSPKLPAAFNKAAPSPATRNSRSRRQSIADMSGVELTSFFSGSTNPVASESPFVSVGPVVSETNPMFAMAAKAGRTAPEGGDQSMEAHTALAGSIMSMQEPPQPEQWAKIQVLYGDMVKMVGGLQAQVQELKRDISRAERDQAMAGHDRRRRRQSLHRSGGPIDAAATPVSPDTGSTGRATALSRSGGLRPAVEDAKASAVAGSSPRQRRRSISGTKRALAGKARFGQSKPGSLEPDEP